jgi:hypothetical protein
VRWGAGIKTPVTPPTKTIIESVTREMERVWDIDLRSQDFSSLSTSLGKRKHRKYKRFRPGQLQDAEQHSKVKQPAIAKEPPAENEPVVMASNPPKAWDPEIIKKTGKFSESGTSRGPTCENPQPPDTIQMIHRNEAMIPGVTKPVDGPRKAVMDFWHTGTRKRGGTTSRYRRNVPDAAPPPRFRPFPSRTRTVFIDTTDADRVTVDATITIR